MYVVRFRPGATVATADHAIWGLWNPHSTQSIRLMGFSMFMDAGGTDGDGFRLKRITTRGTGAATVTPDLDHQAERGVAPASGFVIDLAPYSVQPTLDASELGPSMCPASATAGAAGGIFRLGKGIRIPPGEGIACCQTKASIRPNSQCTALVREDS